jgi:lipopolysaccharide export system protein LptA
VGALAATFLGVGIAYRFRGSRKERPAPVTAGLPSNVDQQVSGYTFTRSDEGRQIFTLHAARTVALKQGGTTDLQDVVVQVFGRRGDRHDVLRTQRAEYNKKTGDFSSPGTTEIELNTPPDLLPGSALRGPQPVYLETSGVYYRQKGSLMVSDEPVRFRAGAVSGSATGMNYATKDGWLELKREVRLDFRPVPSQPVSRLAATHMRYDKETGRVTLSGPLELERGASRIVAGSGLVVLDSRNRLTQTVLESTVQASIRNGDGQGASSLVAQTARARGDFDLVSGGLRTVAVEGGIKAESQRGDAAGKAKSVAVLEAQSAEVSFGGTRAEPQKGSASGNVRLTMLPQPPDVAAGDLSKPPAKVTQASLLGAARETKILTASQIDFSFRPGGRSLAEANTIGQGKLVLLPEDRRQGRREITAGQFVMGFDVRDRPERLSGDSGTRLVWQPPAASPSGIGRRESSSERLRATFDFSTGAVQTLEQVGDFSFSDADRRASAERADYSPQGQVLTLTGHPQVWDSVTRIKAERFLLHQDSGAAEGIGKVQATHFEGSDVASRAIEGPPSLATRSVVASSTTNVLADRALAERQDQLVQYEGHVRAWHGADVIESSSLTYYAKQRRLSSGSSVLTSHLGPASQVAGGSATAGASRQKTQPLTIRADHLEFFDEGHKADYRGNVELQTESTTLRSDRMNVYFSPASTVGGSQVERVLADGHVRVTQPRRRATGDHADYEAVPGKIVMQGGSPSIYDEEKGFTTGQSLTFFIHDDTLLVDGGEKSPTLSKRRVSQ